MYIDEEDVEGSRGRVEGFVNRAGGFGNSEEEREFAVVKAFILEGRSGAGAMRDGSTRRAFFRGGIGGGGICCASRCARERESEEVESKESTCIVETALVEMSKRDFGNSVCSGARRSCS